MHSMPFNGQKYSEQYLNERKLSDWSSGTHNAEPLSETQDCYIVSGLWRSYVAG